MIERFPPTDILPLTWSGICFVIDGSRALFLPDLGRLVISDPHFGKEDSFQRWGVPVPNHGLRADLIRLTQIIHRHQPQELIILGDFFHDRGSRSPSTLSTLETWRQKHSNLPIRLIRGNHDRQAGDPPQNLHIQTINGPILESGIILSHGDEPQQTLLSAPGSSAYVRLAGHIHPVAVLKDRGGRSLRLPCFHFNFQAGVCLPAFGSFTGGHPIKPRPTDRVIVVQEGQALELPVPSPPDNP